MYITLLLGDSRSHNILVDDFHNLLILEEFIPWTLYIHTYSTSYTPKSSTITVHTFSETQGQAYVCTYISNNCETQT